MSTSILNDIKHALGITADETAFDQDIIMFINGTIGTLTQLGVGPTVGYQVVNAENTWDEFYADLRLSAVRSYIFLCAKIIFDPPDTGFVLAAMERQKTEMEYRLNVVADYG